MTDVLRLVEEGIPTEFGLYCYLDDIRRMYVGETGVRLARENPDLVNRLIDNPETVSDFPSLGKGAEGEVYRIGMNLGRGNLDAAVKVYHSDRLIGIEQYVAHLRIPKKSDFVTPTPFFASNSVFAMQLMDEDLLLTRFLKEHPELTDEVNSAARGVTKRAEYATVKDPQAFHLYVVDFNPEKKDLKEKYKFANRRVICRITTDPYRLNALAFEF
ncbi:MAG: hypothetical protein Q8Q86_00555, partial [Candidatus Daviesbacteria bacterium]|nr:hypothetical protein [Candidatus Daviesbacteria bacterium]